MTALNVLVFPCGSEIGLEIHSALKYSKAVRLFGASSVDDHGAYVYARYTQIDAHVRSPDFIETLNALIDSWQIDVVLPAHDSVVLALALAAERIAATVAVPDAETAKLCRNKNVTYRAFAEEDFVPATVEGLAAHYPIFAKPAVGQGSQGAERIDSQARHVQLLGAGTEYVFSEYLPGKEYTVDCISDGSGGLLHASPRVRARVKAGISVSTKPVPLDEEMSSIAERIAKRLRLKGAWFFQLKRNGEGRYKLLEVAPRIAGSMGLSRNLGINYPLLTVLAYRNLPFSVQTQQYPIQLDRALKNCYRVGLKYDTVYLDLDDTLIIDGQVNVMLVALLYQWLGRQVSVVLVTRHNRCPRATLEANKLSPAIFSRIVHIADGSPKSTVIDRPESAIFIDDSFRERMDVSRKTGVPVFDVDAVEQLMDWRL
ncbi:ATP-grasp domain-containing protein [Stutzerimonas sp. VN223-3]|uniref:ATP-grasp domain-containing protein n=1 Tax=Stutzerimonas sp. VN223-3 TaxID=3384601 RepID=UPI0038B4AD63